MSSVLPTPVMHEDGPALFPKLTDEQVTLLGTLRDPLSVQLSADLAMADIIRHASPVSGMRLHFR
jgi:hypothetical protein